MQRSFLTKLLVAAAALALACTSDRSPLPTQPQPPAYSTSTFPSCNVLRVAVLIKALFPVGTARIVAQQVITAIQSNLSLGRTAAAQAAMFAFVKATLADLAAGKLLVVSPPIAPSTPAAVSELFTLLYQCLGLTPPGDITAALSPGGAAAVVGPNDADIVVKTEGDKAGVFIKSGDISATQTVLVTITPDPNKLNPFPNPAGLETFPPFYDFRTTPDVSQFHSQVLVGICVDLTTPHAVQAQQRLQLAHADHTISGTLQILPRADAGFLSTCSFIPNSGSLRVVPAGRKGFVGWLAERAIALLRPEPLHAGTLVFPGGLGGLVSNFTDFRAVDPGKLVFTQQPTNTPAGMVITPAPTVAVEREDNSPITNFTGTVTVGIGTNPSGGTLSGTTAVATDGGGATFPGLSIDKTGIGYRLTASGTSPTGALPAPATSAAFNIGNSILIYGPSMSAPTGPPQNEQTLATAAGYAVTVASAATWAGLTTSDFARYNAIVFGDPSCNNDPSTTLAAADANKVTWSAAVSGSMVVIGTDPQEHSAAQTEAPRLITNGINFAAHGSGTGLYVSLSCYYYNVPSATSVSFLSQFGNFQVFDQGGCPSQVTIVAPAHSVMAGLTTGGLSNWECSVHEFFLNFPTGFAVLASGIRPNDAEPQSPRPYIIAKSP